MGDGPCKGTKGWTFNKSIKKLYHKNINKDATEKKTWCFTILMDLRHCQNSLGNIEQLIDTKGLVTFFKYDRLFEKQVTKSQKLDIIYHFRENFLIHGQR